MIEPRGLGELTLGVAQPSCDAVLALGATRPEPPSQLVERRRTQQDQYRIGSALPDLCRALHVDLQKIGLDPADPPSYRLSKPGRELAAELTQALDDAAKIAANADPEALADLTGAPRPKGILRRIPRV